MLKVDGTLVYSTCTLAPEENEAVVHFILSNYPEMELVPISLESQYTRPGIKQFGKQVFRKEVVNTIRCLPSEETEGFYIAKFRKKAL
jgi:16S rRNA C967 or C1407 C5-methylase (RsmB/RsmF family)